MFDLQGHRGARGLFPENTLEGFAAAIELGFGSFEIDIAITRDLVPVVYHDPALNPDVARGPDGAWLETGGKLIRDLTLAELGRYDVGRIRPGSAYAAAYPTQRPHDGAKIPTLDAVLRLNDAARFNIELKLMPEHPEWTVSPDVMVELVLAVVEATDVSDRVTIQSFDWRAPRHLRLLRPDVPRGWLTESKTVRDAPLWRGLSGASSSIDAVPEAIVAEGGGTWTPHHTQLTPALLDRAQTAGLKVIPWTVNHLEDMRRLIGWGVNGLISDWPDRALPLLR